MIKWARDEIFRFWSCFDISFFPSLYAREPMPKLDFVKVFKKQQGRTEKFLATLFKVQQQGTGIWKHEILQAPWNQWILVAWFQSLAQYSRQIWWLGHRAGWQWLAGRLQGSCIICLCTLVSWLVTVIFAFLNYFGTYMKKKRKYNFVGRLIFLTSNISPLEAGQNVLQCNYMNKGENKYSLK